MDDLFSSDPAAILAAWDKELALEVPMADGTQETVDYGIWLNVARRAIRGEVGSIRHILDAHHRSRHPARKRAAASRLPAPPAAPPGPRNLMENAIRDVHCWACQPGLDGMDLYVVEDGKPKVRAWVMREAARLFPFAPGPTTAGSLSRSVEGLSRDVHDGRNVAGEFVDELITLSPASPGITLPEIPSRPRPPNHLTPLERVLAKTIEGPNGEVYTVHQAILRRLTFEASNDTRGAVALYTRERDRLEKEAHKGNKTSYAPLVKPTRSIRWNFGLAGVGEAFEELGITASIYPRFLLFSWVLDLAWERGGRPEDPAAFRTFVKFWVFGKLTVVPQEYRPEPKVEVPPEAA